MKKYQTTDPIQCELVKYTEDELQKKIVEPLLREMEFKDVRDRSGSNERGKDLTAIKTEGFGRAYYAIQLKKQKLSGKVASAESLARLVPQLIQAIKEKIHFPTEAKKIRPNKLVFITPYPMENAAMCSLEDSLAELNTHGIDIIDGIALADYTRKYLPDFLTSEQSYRSYSLRRNEALREANIALQTTQPMTMEKLYVEVSLLTNSNDISRLVTSNLSNVTNELICGLSQKNLSNLKILSKSGFPFNFEIIGLEKATENYEEAFKKKLIWPSYENGFYEHVDYAYLNLQEVIAPVVKASEKFVEVFSNNKKDSSETDIIDSLKNLFLINEFIQVSSRIPFFRNAWAKASGAQSVPVKFDVDSLLMAKKPICIVGVAGAGKTTFLRHLTQRAAANKAVAKPIFVPILDIHNYTLDGILSFIEQELVKGKFVTETSNNSSNLVNNILQKNNFRVHFDGLDEAGSFVPQALEAIKSFSRKFENTPIVMTSRHTIQLKWDSMLVLSLEPFNKVKLLNFVSNWFNSEPSSYKDLSAWIETHKNLQSVIQTPLMAALLCVLFSVDVELPETENELYSRRLDLLLGQWDSAKGIPKMPHRRRKAYKMFLMNLAHTMQKKETRFVSYSEAVDISSKISDQLRNSSQTVVIDCISRGLLFRDEQGDVSFGHLTYQEHLTAIYFKTHNPVGDIIKFLENPWWSKTLDFYAMQMTSLDQIVKQANKLKNLNEGSKRRIEALLAYAPYTEEVLTR